MITGTEVRTWATGHLAAAIAIGAAIGLIVGAILF